MSGPLEIFVGTDRSQLLAVAVLEHSIQRHTFAQVRVYPLIDLALPEPQDLRQGSRTNFSFARFAIPELMNYQGRALYLDADMLVFGDMAQLWNTPFDGATVIIQEEAAELSAALGKKGAPAKRVKQCSVMLIDCERAHWNVREIVSGLDGEYSYEQLMYELRILPESEVKYGVPFVWNSLEHYTMQTRLLHYTDMDTQPWVSPVNVWGHLWLKEVLLMLETGALGWRDINREIELGYMRPSLAVELREMPHEAGFDPAAAERYQDMDRKAGFVRHAEVYARKKQRAAAASLPGLAGGRGDNRAILANTEVRRHD